MARGWPTATGGSFNLPRSLEAKGEGLAGDGLHLETDAIGGGAIDRDRPSRLRGRVLVKFVPMAAVGQRRRRSRRQQQQADAGASDAIAYPSTRAV